MKKKKTKNIIGYSFIAPCTILLLVFIFLPILMTFYYSFTKYNGMTPPEWIGTANFEELFQSPGVLAALKNTAVFVLFSVPAQLVLALVFAAILAAKFRNGFGQFVRSVTFIPVLCSSALAGTIFFYLFSSDAGGFVNTLLSVLGIPKHNWLGSGDTALGVIIFVSVWKSVGYFLVIFYAGIMDIPNSLYEASEIDGATPLQQFFFVTIPNLKSVLLMVLTVSIIWSFQVFDLTYIMTKGGPGYSTTSLVYQIYYGAFRDFRFGYSSALALVLFVIIVIITFIQRFVFSDKEAGK